MRYRLTRRRGGSGLRTDIVEGDGDPPRIGRSFQLVGKGLEFGSRLVTTSPVRGIGVEDDHLILETESGSLYQLEQL